MSRGRPTSSKARRSYAAVGVLWHAGWAIAVAAAGGVLSVQGLLPVGPELAALGAIAGAAVLGAVLSMFGGPGRVVAILAWGVARAAGRPLTRGPARRAPG